MVATEWVQKSIIQSEMAKSAKKRAYNAGGIKKVYKKRVLIGLKNLEILRKLCL